MFCDCCDVKTDQNRMEIQRNIFRDFFFFCLHGEITIFFSVVSVGFNFLHKYVSFIMKISQHTPK